VPVNTINVLGGNGTPGDLYLDQSTGQYYILKTSSYSAFFKDLNNSKVWQSVGNDKNKAIDTVKQQKIEASSQPYLYHGQLNGNMDVNIPKLSGKDILALDGSVNLPVGTITKESGTLIFQGHPVIHAGTTTSASQKDWESRQFTLDTLKLDNATFDLSRNAQMQGNINAVNGSSIILGSDRVFTDKNDGTGDTVSSVEGSSVATTSNDQSDFRGYVTLENNSTLQINEKFNGGVDAQDSTVNITSTDAVFSQAGSFVNSALTLKEGAHASFENGLFSAGKTVTLEKGASLNLTGIPGENHSHAPVISQTDGFTLHGNASLTSADQSILYGDITGDGASSITLGNKDASDTTASSLLSSLLQGYNTAYSGAVTAGSGSVTMNNALWNVTGDSTTGALTASGSKVSISPDSGFSTLSIGNLNASNTDFVLRTDLTHADKIAVTQSASGKNNRVLVNFLKTPANGALNIPLISAPEGTSTDVFTAGTQVEGFSQVTPVLSTTDTDGKTQWNLTGFKTAPDKATTSKAASLTSGGYKNFMTEVNNMNKRMGELRDTHGDAGAWARIMSGTGSADGGYSDNYTHVQVGFDKKHELDGLDLFTGVTMTYTDSNAGSDAFSGKTKSVGGGLYASALFNSGVYIDLIGKYVHHDNNYTARFAGLGEQDYTSHSWYAGAETGYRYHLTEDTFIEPQAELVYGAVSGKSLHWKDGNMDLAMANKDFNPLIGRTGIEFGKTFSGADWSVTARAGTSWQFDLLANGETVLRDASGEKRIEGERDSRMLFNVGLNSQIKDNVRFGLEFEKSAFGKYNVDNAINANFRYMF
ncbi:TPA: autotransporter outer membrane beta-barrel domain-containing protein, partial [Escherichia coli]|nr:autotransporter outer membrane beta-barrel domain-containing protein [Escherichia coli]